VSILVAMPSGMSGLLSLFRWTLPGSPGPSRSHFPSVLIQD
jgi:hypothetical protein